MITATIAGTALMALALFIYFNSDIWERKKRKRPNDSSSITEEHRKIFEPLINRP